MDAPDGSYEYWLGPRETKYSGSGVERSVKPADTIRRAAGRARYHRRHKGCRRDRPRPGRHSEFHDGAAARCSVRGISYYNGKGTTRAAAHAGALMEAIERHAGERYDGQVIASSYSQSPRRLSMYRSAGNPCPDGSQVQRTSDAGMGGGVRPDDAPADFGAAELCGVALQSRFRRGAVLLEHQRPGVGQYPGRRRLPRACAKSSSAMRRGLRWQGQMSSPRLRHCWRTWDSAAIRRRNPSKAPLISLARIAPHRNGAGSQAASTPGSKWNCST